MKKTLINTLHWVKLYFVNLLGMPSISDITFIACVYYILVSGPNLFNIID